MADNITQDRSTVRGDTMKKRHIVQVSAYYPPHLGGQENAVQALATQLANKGHRVRAFTSTEGKGAWGNSQEGGVLVTRFPGIVFGHAPIMPGFLGALLAVATRDSVVHLHIGQAFTPEIVWLVSKFRKFRYIAQLHIDFEPSGPAGILLPLYKRFILRRVLRAASAVVVLNEKTFKTVRDFYGYKGRLRIMNNGIDEDFFKLKRPSFTLKQPAMLRLLFVGRLSPQKNVPVLLQAIKETKREVHLDIIGEGDETELLRKIIAENKLKNVTLHGRLSRLEVMGYYQRCDALVMPSLYEAQPLVLLEAMAARIPIIGTDVIGVSEHIKHAGIIVEPTVDGLKRGIEAYFKEYALLPKYVRVGYKKAEKLRWMHTLPKYERLYEEVLES